MSVTELERGVQRLEKRLAEVKAFDPTQVVVQFGDPTLDRLRASVQDGLVRTYGAASVEYRRYSAAAAFSTGPIIMGRRSSPSQIQESLSEEKARSIALLGQAIESLREQIEESASTDQPVSGDEALRAASRKVFIVHGHDEGARETLARFVERIGFEPIILHEQASQGRTVIEKVEQHGDVSFAVVLLTPDDEGGPHGKPPTPRARQNVLLELGYFMGRLGRDRVCALKRGELDIPSDFAGVVWQPFDEGGGWRTSLAKELEAAGHEVDWNRVMRS